jgi:hypothetical protein
MLSSKIKDLKIRYEYYKKELLRKKLKFLFINSLNKELFLVNKKRAILLDFSDYADQFKLHLKEFLIWINGPNLDQMLLDSNLPDYTELIELNTQLKAYFFKISSF